MEAMDKHSLRKLIQQEIAKVKEDYLVPKHEVPADFARVVDLGDDHEDHDDEVYTCPDTKTKSLTCSSCGGVLVMEGSCGCSSPADQAEDPMTQLRMMMNIDPEGASHDHPHKKGAYMAKAQLHKIEKYARELQHMIPEGYDLDDWMRSHISQAADDLSEVYHKMEYKSHK